MSTPAAPPADDVTLEEMHFRRVDMKAFRRSDGLFEVVGRVTDQKPHDFIGPSGGKLFPANVPLHDITVRLVFDVEMVVRAASATTVTAPYDDCHLAPPTLECLVGTKMGAGWRAECKRRLGGERGCTHMLELLAPMSTTAYQALTIVRAGEPERMTKHGVPAKVNSCFAYGDERAIVKVRWPAHYKGK